MTSDIPMVKKAQPSGERRLRVRFAGDRRQYVLDLTGLIARRPAFCTADGGRRHVRQDRYCRRWTRRCMAGQTKWGHLELAAASALSVATIRRAELKESENSLTTANDLAIRRALEAAGVEFIDENGGGPGVRLRKRHQKKS